MVLIIGVHLVVSIHFSPRRHAGASYSSPQTPAGLESDLIKTHPVQTCYSLCVFIFVCVCMCVCVCVRPVWRKEGKDAALLHRERFMVRILCKSVCMLGRSLSEGLQ